MGKDPAFLFYPGDYLRDTQTLSENSQVAYDRIMCEHMRNICISQQQLKFFTKRLSIEEKEEILFLLDKIDGGYQIGWVAESIVKRKEYSESRRKNRTTKPKKTSKTYDSHMEDENEDENDINKEDNNSIFISIKNLHDELAGEIFLSEASVFAGMDINEAKELIPEFISTIKHDTETNHRPLGKHKTHFQYWLRKKVESKSDKDGKQISKAEHRLNTIANLGSNFTDKDF